MNLSKSIIKVLNQTGADRIITETSNAANKSQNTKLESKLGHNIGASIIEADAQHQSTLMNSHHPFGNKLVQFYIKMHQRLHC